MKTGRMIGSAFKGLGRNRLRTFLMMISVVIGIAALTMVVAAARGAQNRIMERVRKFGLDSLMINAGGTRETGVPAVSGPMTTLTVDDAAAVRREVKGVLEVAPFNRKPQTEVIRGDRSVTTAVFGIPPEWEPVWDWGASRGEFIDEEDMDKLARTAVIGETVRRELFKDADPIGETIRVGTTPFEIKGIMAAKGTSPGGGDMDNRIYIPLTTFLRRVANIDYLTGIKVRLTSVREMDQAVKEIGALLRERHKIASGIPDDFTVRTPDEVKEMAEEVAGTFNILLILVTGVSLIAGGVVVANIMLISVNERTKEIGLRKAVGAGRRQIRIQFLFEAAAVTVTGGAVGILAGFGGAWLLQKITGTPTAVSWESVLLGVVFSGLVGIVAGLQPANRAAALQPVEALRS